MRTKLRSKVTLLFMTLGLLLAIPAVALADVTQADGDGLEPVGNNDLAAGAVACNVAKDFTVPVAISRNGNAGTTNVFKDGSNVTVTVQSVSGAGLSAVMGASNTITLPSDWGAQDNNTMSSSVSSTVTVNSSVEGAGSGQVNYVATGVSSKDGSTLTRPDTMNVTWTTGTCTVADTTRPDTSITAGPAAGSWITTNSATFTFSGSDNTTSLANLKYQYSLDGGTTWSAASTSTTATLTNLAEGAHTFQVRAVDEAGNVDASPASRSFSVDTIAPSVTPDSVVDSVWRKTSLSQAFTASDGGSGLANSADASFTLTASAESTKDANGDVVPTSVSKTVSDVAGNSTTRSVSAKIDLTAPVVNVTGVSNGATYTLGSVPAAGCSATTDALSGVATQATLQPLSGGPVGQVTATCSGASDNAGNAGSASVTYNVEYAWTGFFQPIDNKDPNTGNYIPNKAKAGSVIPVKFSLAGDQGLGIFATGSPTVVGATGCATGTSDLVEEYAPANASGLKYDPLANQYIYNWKTQSNYAGKCLMLNVKLSDNTTHSALFSFVK